MIDQSALKDRQQPVIEVDLRRCLKDPAGDEHLARIGPPVAVKVEETAKGIVSWPPFATPFCALT
jgi:hypothetical protein